MASVKLPAEILKKVKKAAADSLKNEVAKAVRKEMKENIENTVYSYDAAFPERRREDNGGMLDDDNIQAVLISDDTLAVKSTATVNPLKKKELIGYHLKKGENGNDYFKNAFPDNYDLPEIIEYGNTGGIIANEARPFTENTFNDLKSNKQHIAAMRDGLQKRLGSDNVK